MKSNVLIVDDDEDLADLLDYGLSRLGFLVTVAHTCEEAHRVAADGSFDAIVVDLSLADGSGVEVVNALDPRPRAVVVVSGFEETSHFAQEGRASADIYLRKPVDVDDLGRRIGALLAVPAIP